MNKSIQEYPIPKKGKDGEVYPTRKRSQEFFTWDLNEDQNGLVTRFISSLRLSIPDKNKF